MKSLLEVVKYLCIYPTGLIIVLRKLFKMFPIQSHSSLVIFIVKSDYTILKHG